MRAWACPYVQRGAAAVRCTRLDRSFQSQPLSPSMAPHSWWRGWYECSGLPDDESTLHASLIKRAINPLPTRFNSFGMASPKRRWVSANVSLFAITTPHQQSTLHTVGCSHWPHLTRSSLAADIAPRGEGGRTWEAMLREKIKHPFRDETRSHTEIL